MIPTYDEALSLLLLHVIRDELVPGPGVERTVYVTPATHEATASVDLGYTGSTPGVGDAPVIPYRRPTLADLCQ